MAKLRAAAFGYARTAAYAERSGLVRGHGIRRQRCPDNTYDYKYHPWETRQSHTLHRRFLVRTVRDGTCLVQSMGLPYAMQHRNGEDYERGAEETGGGTGQADGGGA